MKIEGGYPSSLLLPTCKPKVELFYAPQIRALLAKAQRLQIYVKQLFSYQLGGYPLRATRPGLNRHDHMIASNVPV